MEENRPFMPPPPPKMPPPPPRPDMQGQHEVNQEEHPYVQQPSSVAQAEAVDIGQSVPSQSELSGVESQQVVPDDVKKEKVKKEKKKLSVATMLYWAGFGICLVGIALSIYFLVK